MSRAKLWPGRPPPGGFFPPPKETLAPLQNYIARFGHGSAKLARQAQSKEKTLQKMMASGLTERVINDKVGGERDCPPSPLGAPRTEL